MNYQKLENNIIDGVTEIQIKMNFYSSVTLYYPEEEVASLLQTTLPVDEKDMETYFSARGIIAQKQKGRFCFTLYKASYRPLSEEQSDFISALSALTARQNCTAEEVIQLFRQYSSRVHVERKAEDFDYLLYFEDGKPNTYRYCLTEENGHIDCHRFTPERYRQKFGTEE